VLSDATAPLTARVTANFGANLLLQSSNGEPLTAPARKKFGLVVCGDTVTYETDADQARVTGVLPRTSTLSRTDRRGLEKPIAANITCLVAVTAPHPPFDLLLIDQYSIAARHIGVELLIVINKVDALDEDTEATATDIETVYRGIGYSVVRCSTKTGEGLPALKAALDSQTSILVGQSGVGKSSLLSSLLPDRDIRVGALSEASGLGKHTTTVTTWFDLPDGGAIIDSAGVRQFGLDHLDAVDLQSGFREIAGLSQYCKFNDCQHLQEPECAVRLALAESRLSPRRLEHFLALRDDLPPGRQDK